MSNGRTVLSLMKSHVTRTFTRRAFVGAAGVAGLSAFSGCLGFPRRKDGPLKFLFMTDHHFESDFVEGHGITKGNPVYTMWKPGNHAAIVRTYRFINEDPACRDIDFALFGGDQINTGYSSHPQELADEMVNYRRTLEQLDIHTATKGRTRDLDFTAASWDCTQNMPRGEAPHHVDPLPPSSRVIAIQGNHDTGVDEFYRECAFSAGDVRFITFFASYVGLPPPPGKKFHSTAKISDDAIAFIEREMEKAAANPKIRHIVLCSHWAVAPAGKDFVHPIVDACKENRMSDNRRKLLALAEKYGCDLFINGHEHNGRYPVAKVGSLHDINCGSLTADPQKELGAFSIVEIHPDKAVFNVYSRAAVEAREGGVCVVTAKPKRLFVREIPLTPIR